MVSDKIITKTITINAPPSKVWNTLTSPEQMKSWLSELEINVISEWKVGSPITFDGKQSKTNSYKGIILKFEPEKVFQYSMWTNISRLPDKPENYTVIDFTLTPQENKTVLTLTHSNLIAETAMEHSNFYWNVTMQVIKKLVES
ncbi:MAG TPA: SRPBCC domain-containing protein [Bacteroidia bacterium]|jgi:uncharacterized protein YndB with AHSA1/START domain|nr:SRPBCC domain-containing protein [Bacteroidia bacterium]